MKRPDWPYLHLGEHGLFGSVLMSNSSEDREAFDAVVAAALVEHDAVAEFTGWNFHAAVWHADGQFHAEVCQFGVVVDEVSAGDPVALRRLVSEKWGWS